MKHDPATDIFLSEREHLFRRPLTDAENEACQFVAEAAGLPSRLAASYALNQAGALPTEAPDVTVEHLRRLDAGRLELPGRGTVRPRTVPLTPWAQYALRSHVESLQPKGWLLCSRRDPSRKLPPSVATLELTRLMERARLRGLPGVGLRSIRLWGARRAFDAAGRIEDAARILGCLSLDSAARMVGFYWTAEGDQ